MLERGGNTSAVVSTIVNVKVICVGGLPSLSVASQATVVTGPGAAMGNVLPDAGAQVTGTVLPSTRSLAVKGPKLTAAPVGPVASATMLERGGITGAVVSTMVTVNVTCRLDEHTSELKSLMRISYAVFCLKKKKKN